MAFACGLFVELVCLLLYTPPTPGSAPSESMRKDQDLSPKQIIDQMAHTYATCKTYRDEGVVGTVYDVQNMKMNESKHFKTAFVRPDRFRFEYSGSSFGVGVDRYIVWRNGKKVRTWWSVEPGVKKEPSIGLAIAGRSEERRVGKECRL